MVSTGDYCSCSRRGRIHLGPLNQRAQIHGLRIHWAEPRLGDSAWTEASLACVTVRAPIYRPQNAQAGPSARAALETAWETCECGKTAQCRAEGFSEHIFGTCVLAQRRASMSMSMWRQQPSCAVDCVARAPSSAHARQDPPNIALVLAQAQLLPGVGAPGTQAHRRWCRHPVVGAASCGQRG